MKSEAEKAAREWLKNKIKNTPDLSRWDQYAVPVAANPERAFIAGAEWGRQPPQWISVDDKLPERRKLVLIYHDVWGITCGHLSQTSPEIVWRDERGDNIETSSVLYWMPLPAVPEGHENDR